MKYQPSNLIIAANAMSGRRIYALLTIMHKQNYLIQQVFTLHYRRLLSKLLKQQDQAIRIHIIRPMN